MPSWPRLPWAGLRPLLSVPHMKCLPPPWFSLLPCSDFSCPVYPQDLDPAVPRQGAPWSSWHQIQDLNFLLQKGRLTGPAGSAPEAHPHCCSALPSSHHWLGLLLGACAAWPGAALARQDCLPLPTQPTSSPLQKVSLLGALSDEDTPRLKPEQRPKQHLFCCPGTRLPSH